MKFQVRFAPDELMQGRVWFICRDDAEDVTTLFVSACATDMDPREKERHLEDAWSGYRAMTQPIEDFPQQREPMV